MTSSEPTKFAQFWVVSVRKCMVKKYLISYRFVLLDRFFFRDFLIWCVFVTLFRSFLSCFGRFCLVVHSCTMVIHTCTYYQELHENRQGTHTVPRLHGEVGNEEDNLNHFWRFNNLVKLRNFKQWYRIRKYHDLGHPSVKL